MTAADHAADPAATPEAVSLMLPALAPHLAAALGELGEGEVLVAGERERVDALGAPSLGRREVETSGGVLVVDRASLGELVGVAMLAGWTSAAVDLGRVVARADGLPGALCVFVLAGGCWWTRVRNEAPAAATRPAARPAPEAPEAQARAPEVFPTERALIEAAAALPGAALSVCVVGAAEELHALTDAMPVGFVAGRNRGASLVAPARLVGRLRARGRGADADALEEVAREPLDGPRVFEASEGWAVMLSSVEAHLARVEGAAASRAREALGAESARRAGSGRLVGESEQRAGSGRLVGESEQRAAVAWAEALRAPYEPSSDDVSIQWGDGTQHHVATHLKLPHVGSAARPWCFEGAVRELLAFRPRFAPQAPRVAFFVGAVLCRVWTATGGSGGGPALVRLDEGERRADVLRPDEGAGEDE